MQTEILNFIREGVTVVYPSHGIGKILKIQHQEIGGLPLEVITLLFSDDRMTVSIPVVKAKKSGLRPLTSSSCMKEALEILKTPPQLLTTPWNKRLDHYESKLSSGKPHLIAELLRDLKADLNLTASSYSKMNLYKKVLNRFTQELALVENIGNVQAKEIVEKLLEEPL